LARALATRPPGGRPLSAVGTWPSRHDTRHDLRTSRRDRSIGGTKNAATDSENTVYYTKVTREFAERAVVIIADMLRNSLFVGEEIERERGVILEELAAVEDSPDEQAGLLLDALLWPGQALGRDIAGTPESVGAISHERLIGYYRQQYVPNACVVSIRRGDRGGAGARRLVRLVPAGLPGAPADWRARRPTRTERAPTRS
jgi:hypothetical protein